MSSVLRDQVQKLTQLRHAACSLSHKRAEPSTVASIILGGGQGTRLFPLTQSRCKPALVFGGRYRIVDIPIANSLHAGITKIFILTQFLARSLHRHIFNTYRQDALSPGFIEVLSAEQKPTKCDWFQGTADAVRQNIEYLLETSAEFFLILSGDQLYRLDFDKLLRCTEQSDVDVWVATLAVTAKDAPRLGIMKIDESNHIVDFYEKPNTPEALERMKTSASAMHQLGLAHGEGKEFLGSMGIYLFRRSALVKLLEEDPREDFGKHLIPTQVKKGRIGAFVHEGYWEDIGTIESFYEANLALNKENPPFTCHDDAHPIFATNSNLPGPHVRACHIESSTLCEGSIIEGERISNSIIGQRSVIKRGTVVEDSYLMGNDFYHFENTETAAELPTSPLIGEKCLIKRAIIDKNVFLGNRVQLINKHNMRTFDSAHLYVRDGIIVIPRGTVIPNDFVF